MQFFSGLALFAGVMNLWMGAAIRFGGKAGLLNNFFADEKAGKFDRAYARRAGMLLLFSGLLCLAGGAACFWLRSGRLAGLWALLCVLVSLVAYRVHYVRSDKLRGR